LENLNFFFQVDGELDKMLEVVYDNSMEVHVCMCPGPSLHKSIFVNTHKFGGGPWMLGLVGRDKDDCVALCPLLCESLCLAFVGFFFVYHVGSIFSKTFYQKSIIYYVVFGKKG